MTVSRDTFRSIYIASWSFVAFRFAGLCGSASDASKRSLKPTADFADGHSFDASENTGKLHSLFLDVISRMA
jgi:hypothetical protein